MGIIKTDPSQTKAVVGLLSILAVAIVVTVMRMGGGTEPPAPINNDTDAPKEACLVRSINESPFNSSHNPFISPPDFKVARQSENAEGGMPGIEVMAANQIKGNWNTGDAPRIEPLRLGSEIKVTAPENTSDKVGAEEAKPEFTLLATVKDQNGWCAVIKTGDSEAKVVEVGDKMDGGFVVKELSAGCAVLADGRDTIIAKRPRS